MRKRYKKQKTIVILFALGIICCFSIGYAAFSQNFLVSGKGTVIVPQEPMTTDKLIEKTVTTGDGLYEDTTEEGRYIYKGENPNNYITFNNELWRIMSVDKDKTASDDKWNLKIIRNETVEEKNFDSNGLRDSTSNGAGGTYCAQGNYGCNAWTVNDNFVNGIKSGTVLKDAELNTYLNGEYLGTINEDSKYIINHDFNVGIPGNASDIEDIATNVSQEALYKWNGKIGLMTITEILKTTTEIGCRSLKTAYNNYSKSVCSDNNWMWFKSENLRTISPSADYSYVVWNIYSNGSASIGYASDGGCNIAPVLYLTSDIKLLGEGTQDNPYTIVNN